MKEYHFTLQVPDDFDPEQLAVDLSYPEQDVEIINEGFNTNLEEIVKNIKLETLNISSTSVVIIRASQSYFDTDIESIIALQKYIEGKYECTTLALTDDIDVLVENAAEATDMLKRMIDKVNSKSIIKLV